MLESSVMLSATGSRRLERLQSYLNESLGAEVVFDRCPEALLPAFLLNTYTFACGRVLGTDYVFAAPRDQSKPSSPAAHAKQIERLTQEFKRPVALLFDTASARDRQRLMRHRTPFVVPFGHMYLPHSGLDFRERVVKANVLASADDLEALQPSTQLILLYALLWHGPIELRIRDLSHRLGVSEMTVSRGLKELEGAGLVQRSREGRRRPACLAGSPQETWTRALPRLSSPVRRKYATPSDGAPGAVDAGLTALSALSSLAAPSTRTVALGPKAWQEAREKFSAPAPASVEPYYSNFMWEIDQMTVEVWTYDPRLLTAGPHVDPLSLYLSLRGDPDERVQDALAQALGELRWW